MISITRKISIVAAFLFTISNSFGQLSPPGLGKAKTASWAAFGVQHKLDSTGNKYAVAYVGMGRKSSPDNYNPVDKPAILVLNYEIYNKFKPNQQYSYAISYRRQNEFDSEAPFHKEGIEQEFRVYGRYAYTANLGKFKWKNTIRQEFRKFFDADFNEVDENFQLRTRVKSQLTYPISEKNKQSLALSAEGLFATSYMNDVEKHWTKYAYKETRLGLYYMFQIPNSPLTMDIGYVNNLIRNYSEVKSGVHYVAVDLVWKLP